MFLREYLFVLFAGVSLLHGVEVLSSDSIRGGFSIVVPDTVMVMEYNNMARDLMLKTNDNYNEALSYLNRGIALAKEIQYPRGEAELVRSIGIIHYYRKEYDQAILYFQQALEICGRVEDNNGMAENYSNMAIIYHEQSKLFNSLNYLLNALSRWKQSGNSEGMLRAYKEIIFLYQGIENYAEATEYVQEALKVAHDTGNKQEEASLYDILARINVAVGDVWEVAEYYDQSLKLYEELDDQLQIARITQNMAANLYMNDAEKALELLKKSAAIYEELDPVNNSLFTIYNNISNICMASDDRKMADSAGYFKEKAMEKAILSKNPSTMAAANLSIGRFYLDRRNLNEAGHFFEKAYTLALTAGSRRMQSTALSGLSTVKYRMGDYEGAMVELQRYRTIRDSLSRIDNEQNTLQLNLQYEFEKAEREQKEVRLQLARQEQSIRQQSYAVIAITAALAVMAVLLLFVLRGSRLNTRVNIQLKKQEEEIALNNRELQTLNTELSVYRDRLEERVKEQTVKLQQSEIQLRTLSDHLPGGCIYRKIVYPDGRAQIVYIGSTSRQWMGVSPDEIKEDIRNFFRLINADDFEEKKRMEEESARTLSPYTCEFRINRGGQEAWLLENGRPCMDENKNVVWDGIAVDITERKAIEAELIRARQQAEKSDMLKSSFLANMSHEIRTPMNGIVGFLSFLEQDDLPAAKRHAYIRIIRGNVQQLLQLIGDIIDISKIDTQQLSLHPFFFNLNALMEELETLFQDIALRNDKKLEVVLDNSSFAYPGIILSDPVRVRQILSNLIGNAIKFTHKGYIRFGYTLQDNREKLLFFVEDTGIGIHPDKQEIIFERFQQVHDMSSKENYSGTGLGLAISRNLVEMLHGKIWVSSEANAGSVFYFTLPFIPEPTS
ncbi:MAG: tetratricopeptide repeat protein [Bacteroidales bacterium]|jgi:PAS domain S-box-containing protein|nr:tetratricopeptide repeat protein [Bacteroidales bacterium]